MGWLNKLLFLISCTCGDLTPPDRTTSYKNLAIKMLSSAKKWHPKIGFKAKIWVKFYVVLKYRNVGLNLKLWVENLNFGINSKNLILVTNWNFGKKLKFSSTIEIFVKIWNFRQNLKFSSKFEIFVKNWNFHQKSKFSSKIEKNHHKSKFSL